MKKNLLPGLAICLFISIAVQKGDANANSPANENGTAPAATAQAPGALTGTVLETMDSGGYTYFQLDTGLDKPWIAVPQAQVKVGETIRAIPGMVMKNFNSKTLNRTFDSIVFSGGIIGATKNNPHGGKMGMGGMKDSAGGDSFDSAVAAEGSALPAQAGATTSGGSAGAMVPFAKIKVEKASGDNAQLVGDAFTKRKELNGKTVRVQGKVVKFSSMIMGRNWVHLQDGSGDPTSKTHDLVFTTEATVEEGKIITMEGVLIANKDFGSGYKYDAIIEEAKVVQ